MGTCCTMRMDPHLPMRNLENLAQEAGKKYNGWRSKDTAKAFAEYAGHVAEQLGDRVKHYFTINEFRSFVEGATRGSTCRLAVGRPCTWAARLLADCRPPGNHQTVGQLLINRDYTHKELQSCSAAKAFAASAPDPQRCNPICYPPR